MKKRMNFGFNTKDVNIIKIAISIIVIVTVYYIIKFIINFANDPYKIIFGAIGHAVNSVNSIMKGCGNCDTQEVDKTGNLVLRPPPPGTSCNFGDKYIFNLGCMTSFFGWGAVGILLGLIVFWGVSGIGKSETLKRLESSGNKDIWKLVEQSRQAGFEALQNTDIDKLKKSLAEFEAMKKIGLDPTKEEDVSKWDSMTQSEKDKALSSVKISNETIRNTVLETTFAKQATATLSGSLGPSDAANLVNGDRIFSKSRTNIVEIEMVDMKVKDAKIDPDKPDPKPFEI
jgi:hypothetical protein